MSTPDAGPELDLQVMSSVFGRRILTYEEMRDEAVRVWDTQPRCVHFNSLGGFNGARIAGGVVCAQFAPRYSTDIAAAWLVVAEVQRREPGWRFMLLGGDVRYGYRQTGNDTYEPVKSVRSAFGWRAEFFGHIDPTQNTGKRHGEADAPTAPLAICLASLEAVSSPPPVMET